jgi:hypothetical protein
MSRLKNEYGMSITGVIVAAGIGLVIMLAANQLLNNQFKAVRTLSTFSAVSSLDQQMKMVLYTSTSCKANIPNIENMPADPGVPKIDLAIKNDPVALKNLRMAMTKVEYPNGAGTLFDPAGDPVNGVQAISAILGNFIKIKESPDEIFYSTELSMVVGVGNNVMGPRQIQRVIPMQLVTNTTTGEITNCESDSMVFSPMQVKQICQITRMYYDETKPTECQKDPPPPPMPMYQAVNVNYNPGSCVLMSSSCNGQITNMSTCYWTCTADDNGGAYMGGINSCVAMGGSYGLWDYWDLGCTVPNAPM